MEEQVVEVRSENMANIFGSFDNNLKIMEDELNVQIVGRDDVIKVSGAPSRVNKAKKAIESFEALAKKGEQITEQTVRYCISVLEEAQTEELVKLSADSICITAKGRPVKAKTLGQKKYVEAIREHTVTMGIGPAGTGKTYLAVAMAVAAFARKEVSKIILTRPAVEAGEKLGFLPGDLQNKVDPYLRPLYDALFDMLGADTHQKYLERSIIEIAPLAYMRGRTLDDSFIILDEAQNTTPEQMKMFLTRLGFNSKAVITGDITQADLPRGKKSGLKEAAVILKNVEDIAICYLTEKDVVRHELVQKIIKAYQKYEEGRGKRLSPKGKKWTSIK